MTSGSPVALNLRPDRETLGPVATIPAMEALVKRRMPLLRAKRTIEAVQNNGSVFVDVPMVENVQALVGDLRAAGVVARPPIVRPVAGERDEPVDVAALRQRLGMTQEQFATVFQIALPVVRNWEQGRNRPDGVAAVLLRMIAVHPKKVQALLWGCDSDEVPVTADRAGAGLKKDGNAKNANGAHMNANSAELLAPAL